MKKAKKILEEYANGNGWKINRIWKSDRHPVVLFEYWELESVWSPSGLKVYIGFENWDEYESIGVSTDKPDEFEKNNWTESIMLLSRWKEEFGIILSSIESMRKAGND